MQAEWFETWFDTYYYHLFYVHRSAEEADELAANLRKMLHLPQGAKILDLACGKGRHSWSLAAHGYDVTGVDLSRNSIESAKAHESENLHFAVHDMRRPVAINYFDAVVNLFTSFGYFESHRDNLRMIDAVHACLKDNGIFLIDFLNAEQVGKMVASEPRGVKDTAGVHFSWEKRIVNKRVIKDIHVNDNGKQFTFMESVSLFTLEDFYRMFEGKFEIIQTFGEYDLSAFDAAKSSRLIIVCRKK